MSLSYSIDCYPRCPLDFVIESPSNDPVIVKVTLALIGALAPFNLSPIHTIADDALKIECVILALRLQSSLTHFLVDGLEDVVRHVGCLGCHGASDIAHDGLLRFELLQGAGLHSVAVTPIGAVSAL